MNCARRQPTGGTSPAFVALAVLGVSLAPGPVRAEAVARDPVAAEALFRAGKDLLGAGDWAGACQKFDKSMLLDPAVSTLVKIARCREHEGRLATAWYEYQRALKLNRESSDSAERRRQLDEVINQAVVALEPRVPKLRIVVPDAPQGVEVLRDGKSLSAATLGEPLPVDPGQYEIVVRAPGYAEGRKKVVVVEGKVADVEIRLVAVATAAAPAESREPPPLPAPVALAPRPSADRAPADGAPRDTDEGSGQRTVGYVLGGVGLVALGTASYFGLRTRSLVSDSNGYCYPDGTCEQPGVDLRKDASSAQTLAFVFAGVGVLALGTGIVLLATAPSSRGSATAQRHLHVEARLSLAGISATARW